ncbi:MAG: bifunctional oligoribonuclease/PAP phosphatase NrnA [Christensenellales bacterium]
MEQAKNSLSQIKQAKKIAIIAHINPDADAIGSMIALKRLIKKNFETPKNIITVDTFAQADFIDEKYSPLLSGENLNLQNCTKYDLAISVDCADINRLGEFKNIFENATDTLNIDHHDTNTKFAKNNIVAKNCSSTAEVLYLLYHDVFKLNFSADICSLIYSGIITDTNNLTQNIGSSTLKIVFELTEKCKQENYNLEAIRDHFFKNNTKEQLTLLSRALQSLSFAENGKIAMMKLIKHDFVETNATQDDTLGIVDYACKLSGVEIGVIFIKQEDNTYYVSLRSKNEVDVGKIASAMGGGGHKNVSAFKTKPEENLTDVKSKLISLCKAELENCSHNTESIESLFWEN